MVNILLDLNIEISKMIFFNVFKKIKLSISSVKHIIKQNLKKVV